MFDAGVAGRIAWQTLAHICSIHSDVVPLPRLRTLSVPMSVTRLAAPVAWQTLAQTIEVVLAPVESILARDTLSEESSSALLACNEAEVAGGGGLREEETVAAAGGAGGGRVAGGTAIQGTVSA